MSNDKTISWGEDVEEYVSDCAAFQAMPVLELPVRSSSWEDMFEYYDQDADEDDELDDLDDDDEYFDDDDDMDYFDDDDDDI